MSVTAEQEKSQGKPRSRPQVIDDLADGEQIKHGKKPETSDDERQDALDWFLATEDDTDLTHTFEINVGGLEKRKWVPWTVRAVDMDRLRRIRQRSQQQGNRRDRRRAEATGQPQQIDEIAVNIAIVVEGTVSPSLVEAAQSKGIVDPAVIVRARFAHKPGLLAQIASEIMSISGYDDDDVREVDAAQG